MLIKVTSNVLGLAITLLLSRYYGAEILGVVSVTNKLFLILISISMLGFREVLIKDISAGLIKKDNLNYSETFGKATRFIFMASCLLIVVTYSSIDWLSTVAFDEPLLYGFLLLFLPSLVFQAISRAFSFLFIGHKQVTKSIVIDSLLSNVIIVLFIILLNEVTGIKTVISLSLVYLSSKVLTFIYGLTEVRKLRLVKTAGFNLDWSLLKKSMPFYGISIFNTISQNLDILVIGLFLSIEDVAVYAICSRIAMLIRLFTITFGNILAPRISEMFEKSAFDRLKNYITKASLLGLILGFLFVLVILTFGSIILSLWGDVFKSGYPILSVLVFGTILSLIVIPYQTFLKMAGMEIRLLQLSSVTGVLYAILMLASTYFGGLLGAAFAFTLNASFFSGYQFFMARRQLNRLTNPL